MINEANYMEEALLKMKSRPPNADGTIGCIIRPGDREWLPWLAYFYGKRMDTRASFMRERGMKGYMVPCGSPADFDPNIAAVRREYEARVQAGEVNQKSFEGRSGAEMTAEERDRAVHTHWGRFLKRMDEKKREMVPDVRDEPEEKPMPAIRELTDAEKASAARLASYRTMTERRDEL